MTGELLAWLPAAPVLIALAAVGATTAALGCFAVLRRQSLLGDTLAHTALPGICVAYLLTGAKSPLVLLAGALAAGAVGALLLLGLRYGSRLKQDAALGLVLSTFFGLGILLLTVLQNNPDAGQSGLDHFIYGQAAYLTYEHVTLMLSFGAVVAAALAACYKEFKLLSFDPEYGATLGLPRRWLDFGLSLLIVVGVMLSLRAVGVVLTVALLIAPAAAARQWSRSLSVMLGLAVAFGVTSAWVGAVWSLNAEATPTGPAVVLAASALLAVSLLFAPGRGLWWNWRRLRRHRRRVRCENLLTDFYRLGEARQDWDQAFDPTTVGTVRAWDPRPLAHTFSDLAGRGLLRRAGDERWQLTSAGKEEAARVMRNHRLWELYLARRLDLATDHVHRDAEDMEHTLPPEVIAELEANLGHPARDPHGHPIPPATAAAAAR